VDRTLMMRKLSELEGYLSQVREFSSIKPEEYSGDWKIQRIIERTLQMMIELAVDISAHLISDRRLRVPTGYADTFRVLHEGGLISEDLYQVLVQMAKFRNIVVHHYDQIDESIVVDILRNHLGDFLLFRDAVLKIIKQEV
jgi:uncharacterized protein YutE (UPF0331/DUF86 family)